MCRHSRGQSARIIAVSVEKRQLCRVVRIDERCRKDAAQVDLAFKIVRLWASADDVSKGLPSARVYPPNVLHVVFGHGADQLDGT